MNIPKGATHRSHFSGTYYKKGKGVYSMSWNEWSNEWRQAYVFNKHLTNQNHYEVIS